MKFIFRPEFESNTYREDWLEIRKDIVPFVGNFLVDRDYGGNVNGLMIVFRVFLNYENRKQVKQYNRKEGALVLGCHIDANAFSMANIEEAKHFVIQGILSALNSFDNLRFKPAGFENERLYNDLNNLLLNNEDRARLR
tara:strand:+ start:2389 stop:2805 length:417 start_codon:yes stop_codon:yes gene_type:complete